MSEPSDAARKHIESRDQVPDALMYGPFIYGSARLDRLNAEHEPAFWLQLTEEQVVGLARGHVPDAVKKMAVLCLDPVPAAKPQKRRKR